MEIANIRSGLSAVITSSRLPHRSTKFFLSWLARLCLEILLLGQWLSSLPPNDSQTDFGAFPSFHVIILQVLPTFFMTASCFSATTHFLKTEAAMLENRTYVTPAARQADIFSFVDEREV